MRTLHFILIVIASLALTACTMNFGEVGNGIVVSQTRTISEDFTGVKSSAGLEVYLSHGEGNKVRVETDENLQEYIETKVENGVLKLGTSKNIWRAEAKRVYVTFKELDKIEVSSGSSIQSDAVIKSQKLSLRASSGGEMRVEAFSQELDLRASSGAQIKISGKSSSLAANASSGSEIEARDLEVLRCTAKASSGAEIDITVREKIDASASSGGEINYHGNNVEVNANESSSGNVRNR